MSTATVYRERIGGEDRLVLLTPFGLKDAVKQIPGRRWHDSEKFWSIPATPAAAERMREELGDVTFNCDDATLTLLKRAEGAEEVRKVKNLEDLPPIPGVPPSELNPEGGGWLHQRQAFHFAKDLDSVMLAMWMGCLTGDAEITVNRAGKSQRMPLAEVVQKFNGAGRWDQTIPTMVRGLKVDGTLGLVPLVAALDNGVKPICQVTLASGKQIRCTWDHEIVTPGGKVQAQALAPGDEVWSNGGFVDKDGYVRVSAPRPRRSSETGGAYEHRLVMERHLERKLSESEVVHHRNGVRHDNRIENLEVFSSHSEHLREHPNQKHNLGVFLPHRDTVVSVEDAGEERVYDLSVDEAAHTYIANGVVVGNTGKTLVTTRLLDEWEAEVVIVLCPVKVIRVWHRELERWSKRGWLIASSAGRNTRGRRKPNTIRNRVAHAKALLEKGKAEQRPVAIVVNYEAMWQGAFKDFLPGLKADVLVMDESHKVKAYNGVWSRHAAKIGSRCRKRIAMTGTPMPSGPTAIYGQYRALDPGIYGTVWRQYLARYFEMGGYEDREVQGFLSTEAEDKHAKAMASIAYICGKDVLDLPPELDMDPIYVELSKETRAKYDELEKEFITYVESMVDCPECGGTGSTDDGSDCSICNGAGSVARSGTVTVPNVLAKLIRLAQVASGFLPLERPDGSKEAVQLGNEKIELLRSTLEDIGAGPEEPVVVFARFRHDLERIEALAREMGLRHGEISGRKDTALTQDATMKPNVDLAAVQLQAGGLGIDLTRARYAIFYSMDFNLGDYQQSRDRVHRPGQTRETIYIFPTVKGTVDEVVQQALAKRQNVVKACIDRARNSGRLVEDA